MRHKTLVRQAKETATVDIYNNCYDMKLMTTSELALSTTPTSALITSTGNCPASSKR